MNFVWTVGNSKRADACVHAREGRVLTNASASVCLNRTVNNLLRHPRNSYLNCGDFFSSALRPCCINEPGSFKNEKTRLFDLDSGACNPFLNNALPCQFLTES